MYQKRNPLSYQQHLEASKYMPGGNTRTVLYANPFPLTFASGDRQNLTTVDGHTYTDFLGEYTAGIYGHNNPVIKQAIHEALEHGWSLGGQNTYEKQLAKIVCERFPPLELVRFTNSGTEANMIAIGKALAVTKRKKVVVFEKGYHGSTISGRVQSGKPTLNLPHEFVVAKYNDMNATKAIIDGLVKDSLAAILVEPMLGSGGAYLGEAKFLKYLRETATKLGALLIFDEVMTSRLGYHGLGHEMGIMPDLMTLGKWIGGGMSFGAFGGRREIMEIFDPAKAQLEHAGTFNNNVVSMAAGTAGCQILDQKAVDDLNKLGTAMKERLERVLEKYAIVTSGHRLPIAPVMPDDDTTEYPKMYVKGLGSILNIHFLGPDKDALQALLYHHLLDDDIYTARRGFIALNVEVTEDDVERFVRATDRFCKRYASVLKSM